MPKKIQVHTLFCDDVRQENTGKYILIGVYTNEMEVQQVPTRTGISIFTQVFGIPLGDHEFTIEISGPSAASTAKIEGALTVGDEHAPSLFSLGPVPIIINKRGLIRARFRLDGKQSISLGSLPVRVAAEQAAEVKAEPT